MPLSFLLWNLHKKDLSDLVAALLTEHCISVVLFLEDRLPPEARLAALNRCVPEWRHISRVSSDIHKVRLYTRLPEGAISPFREHSRYPMYAVRLPGQADILLVGAHIPDLRNNRIESVRAHCRMLAQTVREAEGEFGSRRTVVIGDFNLDPYDESVVSADGFHAVMSRSLALRKTRCVQGADHHYFYNPMWSHFGDKPQGPHGTWYWQHAEPVCWFWHILDQVLVRPELIESGLIGCDCTTIPDHAGEVSLLTSDRAPDKRRASDHLPLVFRLKCDYDSPVQERRLL